ncbi:MAG: cation diffusion facilitator family transporter, partial [Bacteroidales bacterium]|nr:cation diffusion facilitator family transporter [Bacteroidales bacterium]
IIVAIVVKLLLGWYVKKQGTKLKSDALIASGSDALFDAVITLATLVSAGVMLIWGVSLDGILGTLISALIIKAGIEMLASPVGELLGSRVSPELVSEIKKEIMAYPEVHGVYDIILHNYGPEVMIGSLHVSVDDTLTAQDIHGLTRTISQQMYQEHGIVMTVGVYAVATGENQRKELQTLVMRTLAEHKELIQVHGFYYSEKDRLVTVDVVPDLSVRDDVALCQALTAELGALIPDQTVLVTVDHNYSE